MANARVLFLIGMTVSYALHFAAPRAIKGIDFAGTCLVALAAALSTALYSYPTSLPISANTVCFSSLLISGFASGWFSVRALSLMAFEGSFTRAVYAMLASLVVKTTVVSALSTYAPGDVQVIVAIACPIAMLVCTLVGTMLVDQHSDTLDLIELPKVKAADRRSILALLVFLPVLRALTRSLSSMGFLAAIIKRLIF